MKKTTENNEKPREVCMCVCMYVCVYVCMRDTEPSELNIRCVRVCVYVTAVLLLPSVFGKAQRRQVLLLGHAGAGKTTLFAALRLGAAAGGGGPEMKGATLVSAAPNVAPLENVDDVDLVDVPGHPRLRLAMLERLSLWRKVAAVRGALSLSLSP